ncbi:hypothetical protein [Rhizobium sp. C1]|uniref:hypothetical protein n=1 Tax=Rhizobium sp. C1 TaxID=1349799 RepID=UPI001E5BBCD5|nr:hypothetical protein [Rhizobium sp. C1]MCD2177341.1 hypothetical protein [Rhizobium sp. C1]
MAQCHATYHATNLAAIFTGLSIGFVNSAMNGAAAVRAARAAAASDNLAYQRDYAVQMAQAWHEYATDQAVELENLRAENARLKAAAQQRQSVIDKLVGRAA